MTDVRKLLDEATPLPWRRQSFPWDGDGYIRTSDRELIVYAVNHLPDYEAAVDALERLIGAMENNPAPSGICDWSADEHTAVADAHAALRRLRGER